MSSHHRAGQRKPFGAEEEHARTVLESELGVDFRHHDDGSTNSMPDLLSLNGKHVAEVITTVPRAAREAQKNLNAVPDANLPHCVRVVLPFKLLRVASQPRRLKIQDEVLVSTATAGCQNHWSSSGTGTSDLDDVGAAPLLFLRSLGDGVTLLCVQHCGHSDEASHQIDWTVVHQPSLVDPWQLIRQSLHNVKEQRGGVQALADKLGRYPNKHLLMYPFGPPENLTAEFTQYVAPSNLSDIMPSLLSPPLADIHVWLLYRYGSGVFEGLHVCSGHWTRFGTRIPKLDGLFSAIQRPHYRDA
jgi:hypothetical protein